MSSTTNPSFCHMTQYMLTLAACCQMMTPLILQTVTMSGDESLQRPA